MKVANSILKYKRKEKNTLIVLKMFAYVPSSDPFLVFLRDGYMDTHTIFSLE